MNWFNKYKHQLYSFPSFVEATSSMAKVGTFVGLHFLSTRPTNNWNVNLNASFSILAASYTWTHFLSLNSFVSFAASFWSKFLPTKSEATSAPTLLNHVIWWMTSTFTLILWSSHKYPSCAQERKTLTTVFSFELRAKSGMCSRFSSPEGASFSIDSYGANTSTCVTGSIFLYIYRSAWNCGNFLRSSRL